MNPTPDFIEFHDFFSNTYEKSLQKFPFTNIEEALIHWPNEASRPDNLKKRLESLIVISSDEGADNFNHLRNAYKAFCFDEVVGCSSSGQKSTAYAIWHYIGWSKLVGKESTNWPEAIAIGRALAILRTQDIPEDFTFPIQAARKLKARGYKVSSHYGQFHLEHSELERATEDARRSLDQVGQLQCLQSLFHLMSREHFDYGMFLIRRKTSQLAPQVPSHPYALIYNLALRCTPRQVEGSSSDSFFKVGVELCREIVMCLDLEPSHFMEIVYVRPLQLDAVLQRSAHFEHLLSIRQWPNSKVELITNSFWEAAIYDNKSCYNKIIDYKDQALRIWALIKERCIAAQPFLVSRKDLLTSGLSHEELEELLLIISHKSGTVNSNYISPISASVTKFTNLSFSKPLIEYNETHHLVPFPSAFGPSLLEALLAKCFENQKLPNSTLVGDGTEAIVRKIIGGRDDSILHCGEKYTLKSPNEQGECDFVIETNRHLLFIECKAKAPTRATMAGENHSALLDYSAAILAAQVQLLTHERIIRQRDVITFESGIKLKLGNRQIWRLSVTLHEHGGLQDTSFTTAITKAISQVSFTSDSEYRNQDQIDELNKLAVKIRKEFSELQELGIAQSQLDLTSPSLCVAHLASILDIYESMDAFIESLRMPVSHSTQNPLLEHLLYSQRGKRSPSQSG